MEPETQDQIAPGEEAAYAQFDAPYAGPAVHEHMGVETLNGAFAEGAAYGRY
jgi:hypothetical protein